MRNRWQGSVSRGLARIGGPNSVSWPGFWILLSIGFAVTMAGGRSGTADSVFTQLAIGVAAPIAVYSFLALARVSLLRGARTRPLPVRTVLVFVAAAIVGLLAGSVVGGVVGAVLGPRRGTPEPPDPAVIIGALAATVVSVTMVLCMTAVVVDSWREYRLRDREMRDLESQIELVRTEAIAEIESQNALARTEVADRLLAEIDALDSTGARGSGERLRATALDVVRPLSHQLGLGEAQFRVPEPVRQPVDLGQLVADATSHRLLAPVALALLPCVPVAFYGAFEVGTDRVPLLVLATFVVLFVVSRLANTLFARVSSRAGTAGRIAALALALTSATLLTWATWVGLDRSSTSTAAWGLLAWIIPIIGFVLLAVTAVQAVQVRQQDSLEALQGELAWQVARARELQWVRQSALARSLHGPVQSAAFASALRLEAALDEGSLDDGVVQQVRSWLAVALDELASGAERPVVLREVLDRLREIWSGVCDIAVELDQVAADRLLADAVSSRAVAGIVEEGCANAVRHGAATRIHVSIRLDEPRQLQVTVHDNGRTVAGESKAGLGSRLLDMVAVAWQRESGMDGTVLRVLLPVQ